MYCHNVAGLLQAMSCAYDPTEWRLFIDSSKASLKCVLLHNGNRYASIPIGQSVHLKETYKNMMRFESFKHAVGSTKGVY